MKKTAFVILAVFSLSIALVPAREQATSLIASTPQWEKIKSLVGEWEGYMTEGGQKMDTLISVRMTGDGSAVMHWIDAGTPHEMITMFHLDKSELLATHYCAAHNQPRMRATSSVKPNEVAFEFKDGTNIREGDGYMKQLVVTFVDADHHNETWGYDNKGKVETGTMYLTRIKQPPKK